MKCVDITISALVMFDHRGKSYPIDMKCGSIYETIVSKLKYYEELFNREDWPYYHSASYRYENGKVVIDLLACTTLLCLSLLLRDLLPPSEIEDEKYTIYKGRNTHLYIDLFSVSTNIKLPYVVYYSPYIRENHKRESLRVELEEYLLSIDLYDEVRVELLSKCIAVGVITKDPYYGRPRTDLIISDFLEERS